MKRCVLLLILFCCIIFSGCEMLKYIRDRVPPPQQTENGIIFRYVAPAASSVHIAGDFNNWADNQSGVVIGENGALHDEDGDGIWEIILDIAPGRYEYKMVVDHDQWYEDPNAWDRNSVIIVY